MHATGSFQKIYYLGIVLPLSAVRNSSDYKIRYNHGFVDYLFWLVQYPVHIMKRKTKKQQRH